MTTLNQPAKTTPDHSTVKPHEWVSKSGRPWSLRVRSDICAACGCTPDCPAHQTTSRGQ